MAGPRYALYFTPPAGTPLWAFGCSVLGYDADRGCDVKHLSDGPLDPARLAAWTASPRTYGFHGTLKAPFHLVPGATEGDVVAEVEGLAATLQPVAPLTLQVAALGSFIALVPSAPSGDLAEDLAEYAAACVRSCEQLRAPLSAADRARRLSAGLTERQIGLLDRWGYPFVMEEFRFHMTLTGALDEDTRAQALGGLAQLHADIAGPLHVDGVTLAKQESRESRFRIVRRFAVG